MNATTTARASVAVLTLLCASPAVAHETLHEVERGKAIAVKAFESDGDLLADVPYEVYSPADPKLPWATGRTDRGGWLAFVPDVPGAWRIRVIEADGHGLDLKIEAAPAAAGGPARGVPSASGGAPSALAFALRPVAGVLAIAAVFGVLWLIQRRRKRQP